MDELKFLKCRRSVRSFKEQPLAREALSGIIDAARFAPTARNVQPWEFIVVTEKETLRRISALAENGAFLKDAPACIVVFCQDTKYYLEDGCAATCNILLAASVLGIGSCWIAGDKKPYCAEVGRMLKAGNSLKLVSLVALGYPKEQGAFREAEKRSVDELLHWEKL